MKKLALSLLLSTIVINTFSTPVTTNIGPIQLITTNGVNTFSAGEVNLYGTINIGQTTSDIIRIKGAGITYPSLGGTTFIMIGSDGQMLTSAGETAINCGNLTAASNPGQMVTLGIYDSNENYFTFTNDSGNIVLCANATDANLLLSSNNNIKLACPNIIPEQTSGLKLLAINPNSEINTADENTSVTLGTITSNSLTCNTLNASSSATCGDLTAATNANQNINLGNDSGYIILKSTDINWPNSGNSLLILSTNGKVGTADNTTAITCGALASGDTTCASLTAAGTDGQTITLGNNTGSITISGTDIHRPSSNLTNLLGINSLGNIITTTTSTNIEVGSLNAAGTIGQHVTFGTTGNNYFNLINNSGNVSLQANLTGSNLILSAESGHINLTSFDINKPTGSEKSFLIVNSSGDILTAGDTTNFTCGNLTAAGANSGIITLGINDSTHNNIYYATNAGSLHINANTTDAFLELTANSNITLSGSSLNLTFPNINYTANATGNNLIAIDRNGNLIDTTSNSLFTIGNDQAGNNLISVDNETASNGITLSSNALYLANQGLAPESGSTNILTIDSTGKIGIVVSSKVHKDKIKQIKLDESFDSLEPVSYNYKGSNKLEYGFIAEDLVNNKALKNAVIYSKDGTPMSINYTAVFVALTANYLETKKELKNALKLKDEEIANLMIRCQLLEEAIAKIANQLSNK